METLWGRNYLFVNVCVMLSFMRSLSMTRNFGSAIIQVVNDDRVDCTRKAVNTEGNIVS